VSPTPKLAGITGTFKAWEVHYHNFRHLSPRTLFSFQWSMITVI